MSTGDQRDNCKHLSHSLKESPTSRRWCLSRKERVITIRLTQTRLIEEPETSSESDLKRNKAPSFKAFEFFLNLKQINLLLISLPSGCTHPMPSSIESLFYILCADIHLLLSFLECNEGLLPNKLLYLLFFLLLV